MCAGVTGVGFCVGCKSGFIVTLGAGNAVKVFDRCTHAPSTTSTLTAQHTPHARIIDALRNFSLRFM
jgi:hypothetical protein